MSLRLLPISLVLWVLLAGFLPQAARCAPGGAQPADGKTAEAIRFRRVYAPADRRKDWPRGSVKYMPMEPAEFERLLTIARTTTPGARASVAARTLTAQYQARLVGDQLLVGQATLQVKHSADTPTLLPLDPCGLAIGKASWANSGQTGDEPRGTVLGLGLDGRLEVLVEGSGRLDFDWSLVGSSDASGVVNFQLELPCCPVNRLILDLPEKMTPITDHGVVIEAGGADEGFRRWQIELGAHHGCRLRVVPAGTAGQRAQLALVRESVVYDFSLRGVDVSARLNLEVHNEPLRQVALELDSKLKLVTAQYGEAPVPWTVTSTSGSPLTRLVLTLPEPIQGTGRVLRLRALAPLVTDRPWTLPRIRPEGTFWQEGSATLLVPAPLLVKQLVPIGCRQSGTGPLSAPRVGESAEFQFFAPDATVEVLLAHRRASVQLAGGTAIELGGGQITARVVADFRIIDGSRFSLEADVARSWLIDSVESLPPEAMDDWTVNRPRGGKRKLTIRLAKALSPARPLRLVITARRLQSPLNQPLGGIVPLRFVAPQDGKQLVAVRAVGPYQLTLAGAEQLTRIDSHSLDAAEIELFAEPPRGLLFENDAGAADLRIGLEGREPSYSATLEVEASVEGETLRERYVLHCKPESARVDRVVVRFSHRREVPLHWTLGAEDEQELSPQLSAQRLWTDERAAALFASSAGSATLSAALFPFSAAAATAALSPAAAAAGLGLEQESWVLTLRRPRSEPFTITGTREIKLAKEQPVSLASLSGATSQQARLIVYSLGPKAVQITTNPNSRLKPIPADTVPSERYQTARAAYRYDPAGDAVGGPEPAVTVSISSRAATPPAWVWRSHLESRYEADGTGRHLATYRLQNSGGGRLQLTLPPKEVCGVRVDGKRDGWHRLDDGLAIDLPPDRKFPTVWVHFTTPPAGLGIAGSLKPPLPQADLPVLSQHWTVWLPPGYEAVDPDPRWQPSRTPQSSWSRRLFGPLGRAAGQPAFDPLSTGHWSRAASDRAARNAAKDKAEEFLKEIGKELEEELKKSRADPERGNSVWGELLTSASVAALQGTLLVDRHAVARVALRPQTPVRPVSGDDPSALGVSLLQKANLALLVHPDAILLTSQTEAALGHAYLEPLGHQTLWWVQPGPLAEQLQQAAAGRSDHSLVTIETWKQQPAEPSALWIPAGPAAHKPADTHGWTAYRLEFCDTRPESSHAPPVRLKFVHRQTMRLLGWVTFLLAVALLWWTAGNRPVLLTSLVGVFGVTALLLPEAYVPIASGAVLGTLFCLALGLIRRRDAARPSAAEPDGPPETPSSISTAIQLGTVLFAVAALGAPCAAAGGEEPEGESPPALPAYRVFMPIDQKQQPTGGKYEVPLGLYSELHRRAAAAAEKPQGWLITAATYRGVLSRQTTSQRLVVDELKVNFDLRVFGLMARVRIPLHREGANLLPEGALLDGRVIQPEWEADGDALVFEVPRPGQYRLELSLRPTMRSGDAPAGFDLTIPPLASSRLELLTPPGAPAAPAVSVPSAIGSTNFEDQPPRLVAELGPASRLSVYWPRGTGADGAGPAVDVEELLWLKVLPGSVVVDAKFKFKIIEGQVRRLQLAIDPRLRLLPLRGDDPPAVRVHTAPGQPRIVTLQWPRPVSGQTVVEARFLLTGTSGVGNLRLPQLGTLGTRPTRRWLAVSVHPALKHEKQPSDRFEAVAVPDFLSSWGEAETQPRFVHRLAPGETDWSISTHPGEPETTVEQTLAVSFGREGAEVHFDASLETSGGYNFQYRLTAPPDLRIEHVSLLEEAVQHAARWSQNEEGTITIFLTGPVSGRQELSLRGRLPTWGKNKKASGKKRMRLPVLQIERSELQSSEVKLYRRPSVLVTVGRTGGLVKEEDPLVEPPLGPGDAGPELGRLVGRFRAEGNKSIEAMLTLAQVRAEQLIRLRCDGESWEAEVDCRIHAASGVVDQVRIDAPSPWNGPYQVNPPTLKVVDAPGERRQLIVRPPPAIDGTYQFSISSPLKLAPGDRPGAPAIELREVGRVTRMLALPTEAKGQPIEWETRGLERAELPEGFVAPSPPGAFDTYKVVAEPCQATLKPGDQTGGPTRVRLADVRVAWKADRTCHGVTTFDLEPGQSSEVPLWLPSGYTLVQVTVAGVPAVPVSTSTSAWKVPLIPGDSPQRVEVVVVFTGILPQPATAADQRFDPPTLGKLPVEQTLWTVVGPSMFEPGEAEGTSTAEPWHPADASRQLSASPSVADDPLELWQWLLDRPQAVTRCTFPESEGIRPLTLTYRRAEAGRRQSGLAPAAVLVMLIMLVVLGLRRGTPAELFKRWPCAIGATVGLAWWLWLSPSILGWGIVLVSLAASLRSGWKRSDPAPGSSVISLRSVQR